MAGLKNYDFTTVPPVLVNECGTKSPRSFELDASKVTSYVGEFDKTQKILYPGVFLGSSANGTVRALPRTKLADALTASSTTTFNVSTNTARHFVTGEALKVIAPMAVFTFALTWAAADTATAVIDGVTVTTTAVGASLVTGAAAMATAINANFFLSQKVVAITDGVSKVYVYARDFQSLYTTTASEVTAGSGTFAVAAAAMVGSTTIGTILTVDALTDEIVLAAASAASLPVGIPIGVITSLPYDSSGGYGLLSPNETVDLLEGDDENIKGLFVGGTFYEDRLPYVDDQIKGLFPEMVFI
jgi:hypothetical protein